MNIDVDAFVDRYVAVWNEPDPGRRDARIADLWAADGGEFTDSQEHRGRAALRARITDAHEQLVDRAGFVFRTAGDTAGHHDAVRSSTYMLPAGGGAIAWTGFVVALLGADGRILRDYQFGDPPTAGVVKGQPPGTRAVVGEFLRRCGQGSPEDIAELYAPRTDWRVSWPVDSHPAVPWIRPRSTREDVADHYRTFNEHCPPRDSRVSIDHVVTDGTDAVLTGTSSQVVAATGRRFTMAFALRLTVEDGLITRHHMYEDSLAVVQAFTRS